MDDCDQYSVPGVPRRITLLFQKTVDKASFVGGNVPAIQVLDNVNLLSQNFLIMHLSGFE